MRCSLKEGWTLSGAGFTVSDLQLPVSIPRALSDAGIIEKSDIGLDALRSEWIFRRRWTLTRCVSVQECTQERLILSLGELTGRGEIYINGRHAADFDGPCEIEATDCLESGQCRIAVRFAPGQGEACEPFGMGEGAQLRGVSSVRLMTARVQAGDTALRAFIEAEAYVPGTYVFRYAFEQAGRALGSTAFECRLSPGRTQLEHLLEAENGLEDALRWREGTLNAPLHVRLLVLRRGEACDAALMRTGLRRIDRAHGEPGLCACVCGIDGRRASLMGALYEPVPMEEKHPGQVVAHACAAGMSALYVRGCADAAFYDACDVQGLMIFQELPLQAEKAERMIAALSAHPCIVQWGCASVRGTQGRISDLSHPVLAALAEALNRWADERPFVGASGGAENGSGSPLHALGPEHAPGPERMTRFFEQDSAPYRTMRLPALENPAQLRRLSGGMEAWDAQAQEGGGPLWAYRGGIWPPADRLMLRDFTGEDCWDDAEKISRITHFWQAECVRYALECARLRDAAGFFAQRLGGERNLLCDDRLVSPDGRRRAAYHAFVQAMKPVHVCARLDRTGWWTDTRFDAFVRVIAQDAQDTQAQIEAVLYRADGSRWCGETFACTLESGEYGCFHTHLPDEPGAVLLRLTLRSGDRVLDQTDQLLCVGLTGPLWPLLHLPGTTLRVKDGDLENTGGFIAFGVCGPGLSWRALLPGEKVAFEGLRDEIESMNAVVL